ncbi:hypothetical protein pb186bvf_009005 [Paramecium bursaria]
MQEEGEVDLTPEWEHSDSQKDKEVEQITQPIQIAQPPVQLDQEAIDKENQIIDELLNQEDEEQILFRRRQQRELLFQQYEQFGENQKEQVEEVHEDQHISIQIDQDKQNYLRMLDHERKDELIIENTIQQPSKKKDVLDMFATDSDEEENNEPIKIQIQQYHEEDDRKYFKITPGENIRDYIIVNQCGKGVFGNVCKALKNGQEFAIKFLRQEEIFQKSGDKERQIIKQLNDSDKNNRRHIIRLIESFEFKKHICLVFESMDMNLREAIKVYGQGKGLGLDAIRSYAMQLFLALAKCKELGIIHADLKPDNILISKDTKQLKLCDFGTAFTVEEATLVEYLVSRYYRAPEILIGYQYDTSIDMWSAGCTFYELYTGQFLFPGETNNEMLKLQLQTMGKFSMKILKRSALVSKYFDQNYNFLNSERDPITKQIIQKPILLGEKPTRSLNFLLKDNNLGPEEQKKLLHFKDLLDKCLQLDPKNRITPEEAIRHPFISPSIKL